MEYRKLGNSGLEVSKIGLGGNNFGLWVDEQVSIEIINHALEIGVNFIDTADWYAAGLSEEIIGKALKGKRHRAIIATKFGMAVGEGPNEKGGARHHILNAVEDSLRRLKTDHIDLYQMHTPDPRTPLEETLGTLENLVRSGKVRYIGCCNFASWQICEALWISKTNFLESFVTLQTRYNVLERQIEGELASFCRAYNIGVIPWGPLAAGFLTGKYPHGKKLPADGRLSKKGPSAVYDNIMSEPNWKKLIKLESIAEEKGHKVGELAIAWLLSRPWVSTVIAGATKTEQLTENVVAGRWKLTPEEVAQIDKIS